MTVCGRIVGHRCGPYSLNRVGGETQSLGRRARCDWPRTEAARLKHEPCYVATSNSAFRPQAVRATTVLDFLCLLVGSVPPQHT